MGRYAPGYRDNPNLLRTAEMSGHDRIAGAALVFKYLDNALFWQTWLHKAPNHFINAVETAENACLIPLLKNEAFTGEDFEATWELINRFRIQNDMMVADGKMIKVPMPLIVARAKLTRTILRCKDLFDTHSYAEFDWAVDQAGPVKDPFQQTKVPVSPVGRMKKSTAEFGDMG